MPLPAARFALCLHAERRSAGLRLWLEAGQSIDQPTALALGKALVALLVGQPDLRPAEAPKADKHARPTPDDAQPTAAVDAPGLASPPSVRNQEAQALAEIWHELLGVWPGPESDFFVQGGSSLMAMRLASAIHGRLGRRLLLNQFLRRPTYGALLACIRDDPEQPFAELGTRSDGDPSAPWAIAIPRLGGPGHRLPTACGVAWGPDALDVMAFDLATIADDEAGPFDPARFLGRFAALSHAQALRLGRTGPVTLVGYSLGGLGGVGTWPNRLRELGHAVGHVVLLDAYAPAYLTRTPLWLLAKLNAQARRAISRPADGPGVSGLAGQGPSPAGEASAAPRRAAAGHDAHAKEAARARWRRIHAALARWSWPRLQAPATLVRSTLAADSVRPVRHASTNGLAPWLAGPCTVRPVPVAHLEMLTAGAERLAETVADLLTVPGHRTAPPHAGRSSPSADRPG
ncbi:MAG: hypothetical protein KatS3mg103_0289 [Phycisphaerales bacterium]|nr:MAG: hypothetical protein KatS3mg103_0289 [Phycisphaerales bacterium]